MNALLEGEHLSKTYRKSRQPALDDVTFTPDAQAWLHHHPLCAQVERLEVNNTPALRVWLNTSGVTGSATLLADLVHAGFPVRQSVEEKHDLESLFLTLTQGGTL